VSSKIFYRPPVTLIPLNDLPYPLITYAEYLAKLAAARFRVCLVVFEQGKSTVSKNAATPPTSHSSSLISHGRHSVDRTNYKVVDI